MALTCLRLPFGQGVCAGLEWFICFWISQMWVLCICRISEKWQSSEPGSSPNLVQLFRLHRGAQLAADVKHVERAHGELFFFHDWMLVLGSMWKSSPCLYRPTAVVIWKIIILIESTHFSCFLSDLSEYVLCENMHVSSEKNVIGNLMYF